VTEVAERDGAVRRCDVDVDADAIGSYASAVHDDEPIYHSAVAARAAGVRDGVAPPLFAVGGSLAGILHAGQEFVWGDPVQAGDAIATEARLIDERDAGAVSLFVLESVSRNQHGREVARGRWTIARRNVTS
jgi:acyl dehydratase